MQEVQVSTLEGAGPAALMTGTEMGRLAGNRPFAQWGIHACKDGYIGVASMPRQSFAIYDCIGHPELKEDPAFVSGWLPDANALLSVLIPEWTAQHTAEEIFAHAAKFRAPFSMIPTPHQLLNWPGLTAIGFWKTVEHPVLGEHPMPSGPIAFNEGYRGDLRAAPRLGEHTGQVLGELAELGARADASTPRGQAALPLDGVRVVDMTAVWAGPYGTRFLADMGAEVIKVEGPSFADPVRTMTGARQAPEINQSSYFNEYNRNKLGVSLDIKQPEGMEALRRLIAVSDVFIENWSSGVAERLGLGFSELRKLNPRIISVSMPGFGHSGPDAERVGFGPTIEQMGGLVALQGYEGGEPHRSGISYGDPVAGTVAAGAVAMALLHRERTGEGSYAVVPQRDAICGLIAEFVAAEALGRPLPTRIGNRDANFAPHGVYQAAGTAPRPMLGPGNVTLMEFTDSWLAIAVDNDQAWQGLRSVIKDGRLDLPECATAAGRLAAQDAIDAVVSEWARSRGAAEASAELQAAGVPAAEVLTPLLSTTDEHLVARGEYLPYEHPDAGRGRTTRPAWRFHRRPANVVNGAPRFGEHSREVLERIAGYSADDVEALSKKNVVTADLIAGAAG
jgi:crotonobetainyl-CoA:carnitine CoA-transferase CaiB-like acyl-CoA transferase